MVKQKIEKVMSKDFTKGLRTGLKIAQEVTGREGFELYFPEIDDILVEKGDIHKKIDDIAQRAECPACSVDMECPKCSIKMMDEHLWLPLSSTKDLLLMYNIEKKVVVL